MTSYLSKLKKADLQSLATEAGVKAEGLKEELVTAIDAELKQNATKHSSNSIFSDYYARAPRASSGDAPRRKTITSSSSTETSLIPRTPASVQRLASKIQLPSSPALNRAVTSQKAYLTSSYKRIVKKADIQGRASLLRQELGSVTTVQILILLFEAVGLSQHTSPLAQATIPKIKFLNNRPTIVRIPDLMAVTKANFWPASLLWILTSVVIPAVFSYFLNLTYQNPRPRSRRTRANREFDPLVFSIVKGLVAYAVYSNAFHPGFALTTVKAVNDHVYGGPSTFLIGSAVGVLTSIYDNLSFKS